MKIAGMIALLLAACASTPKQESVAPQTAITTGAVIAGDYPDPSIIRVGEDYWAVATSSAWAPAYPILHSRDLANWTIASAVFPKPPEWSFTDYWAPEIAQLNQKFYVFYSARNRKTKKMCVASAVADQPQGPYKDEGPLVCGPIGSIDASAFQDGAKTYLTWKEDGNSIKKPTPIHIQELDLAHHKMVGKLETAIVNDTPWERELVEGPFIFKRGDTWYLFYSGNACCTRVCNYAVGVARAKSLRGPWEKNPANPILRGNSAWSCPGHGTVAQDSSGRDVFMYHAYNPTDSVYVGRQALVDEVTWGADGWPRINNGNGPGLHAEGLFGSKLKNAEQSFEDDFSTSKPGWQWPSQNPPQISRTKSDLTLTANKNEALIARSSTSGNYTATTAIDLAKMKPGSQAAIAAYGDSKYAIGLSATPEGTLSLWTRDSGKTSGLETIDAAKVLSQKPNVLHVQMRADGGHILHFAISADEKSWHPVGQILRDAYHLPPWDLGLRVALIAQKGEAHFQSIKIEDGQTAH